MSEKQASEVEDAVGNDEPEQPPTSAPLADDDDEAEGVGDDELQAEGKEGDE
jgi:hypothetical protein